MGVQSQEIRTAAIERSLLDLDKLLEQGVEHMALGELARASENFGQFLTGLDSRFGANLAKIPIDVVNRRFRVLTHLAECVAENGQLDEAVKLLEQANTLAKGPLVEYPEFTVQSDVDLCRHLYALNEPAKMKRYINEAGAIVKNGNDAYLTALFRFSTGLLFSLAGRHNEAINILNSAADQIPETSVVENIILKARIMLQVAQEFYLKEATSEASGTYSSTVEFLLNEGKKAIENINTLDALRLIMFARKYSDLLGRDEKNTFMLAELFINIGNLLNIRGRWNIAIIYYHSTIELFHSAGRIHPQLHALAYLGMSDVCIEQKDYARAGNLLERAQKCAEEFKDLYCLAKSYYYSGLNLSKSGSDERGIAVFEEAAGLLQTQEKNRRTDALRAAVNNQLGFIASKGKNLDQAVTYLEESIDLLRAYPTDPALGEAYRILGDVHCKRNQHIQGERALRKALDICEKQGAVYEAARCYKSLGENALGTGDLDTANFFLEESLTILENLGIESDLPMVYSAKARICIMQEDYEDAEKLYQKDYDIAKKTDNSMSVAFSLFQLGRVRRLLKRTHSAEDYLQRSLDLFEKIGNKSMAGQAMLELALCISARRDAKSASDLCAKAQAFFEQSKNQKFTAQSFLIRGVILRDTKDAKRRNMSQRFFEDALHILEKINKVSVELAEALYEYALFWRDGKDRKRAVEYISEAIDLCKKLGLNKKASTYLDTLQGISPEDATKLRLSSLVDKAAVEQLTKNKAAGGVTVERKNMSILFTDIRNFTTISETLELDVLTSFLNDFYNDVSHAIHKHHGSINKFIGDAVMVIFNMDGKLENHAEWAVRAAVELSRSIQETNMIRRRRGEIDINIGVGINTGEVLMGSFGSSIRQDYTAIGDGVNTASRIQNKASNGEIIITPAVYEQVKDLIEAQDMGKIFLKGKDEPVQLWKVSGLRE